MRNHRLHRFQKQITQIILVSTVLAGCGYTTRSTIASKYHSIYVVPFVNKIDITKETGVGTKYKLYKPMLETDVTKAVVNKYLLDGNFKPVKSQASDLTLRGELVEFRRNPERYTDDNEVEEYRIDIVVNISLWDNKEDKLLWEENNFTGQAHYFTAYHPIASDRKTESSAINDAIKDLARRIVERAVEEW